MNDLVKYRAWNKDVKQMFGVGGLQNLDYLDTSDYKYAIKDNASCIAENNCPAINQWTDIILMKFIGLKDRNGVDIYEGDIVVRYYYYDDLYPNTYTPANRQKKVISFINKPNCQLGYNVRSLKDGTANHLLVVGNIYANPEMIKE